MPRFADRARRLTLRWKPGAVASRRVGIGLGSVLLFVCSTALFGSWHLYSATLAYERASKAVDLYQDARFYSAAQAAELATYRLNRTNTPRVAHNKAATDLDQALAEIAATEPDGGEAGAVAGLQALHERYQTGAAEEIRFVDINQSAEAARLEVSLIAPMREAMNHELAGLEQQHRQLAMEQRRSAHRDGVIVLAGIPVVTVLAMSLLGVFLFITRGYRRKVAHQAMHDALTGLPNRLLFADRVEQALAVSRRSGEQPVVMVLDLDQFKEVNDTLGHHFGDQMLIEVAARLLSGLRPGDTVARLGGDEFAVLLPDGGLDGSTRVATRLLECLESPFTLDAIAVGVEASVGIATALPEDPDLETDATTGTRMQELLRQADSAMYVAKSERSGFSHFITGQDDATPARLALLSELRQAFDQDELVLHYQPKVSVDTGALLGVEALVRWQHPTRGLLAPIEFIPLAEGTTLIHRLTSRVLEKALALSREWTDRGHPMPVAVNVSARTLLDMSFPATVAAHLVAAGVPPAMLCLELTESTIMSDPERALAILGELHDMGVRLSVDDFGTGYSSMAYLKVLPVDELKVDRSFVLDMTRDPSDTVLVQSAVDLGHNLGLSVVAEGVEDSATLHALRAVGADVVQGYFLGRPMAAAKLDDWIATRPAHIAVAQAVPASDGSRARFSRLTAN